MKTVQVDSTVVSNPEKVKEEAAANLVQDSLRNALRSANIELGDSAPIHAHIVLMNLRLAAWRNGLGLGWARDVAPSLVNSCFQDAAGKKLANAKIHVRGNLFFSPYQSNNTQRRQVVSSFEQRLLEDIEKLK